MTPEELTPHAAKNRAFWNSDSDAYQERHGAQLDGGLAWGIWHIPESELQVLGDVGGLDVLEFGCGAAQWSIALAERGARATGLDISSKQLEHARRAISDRGLEIPLIEASAEDVPLPDGSFDVVFCDHGVFNFTDPHRSVPEAARLLRAGGLLAFSVPSPLIDLFYDVEADELTDRLHNTYWDIGRFDDGETVDFQLPYGEWVRLFRKCGLELEDLIELRAPEGGTTTYELAPYEWARRWPAENIWKARKATPRAGGP